MAKLFKFYYTLKDVIFIFIMILVFGCALYLTVDYLLTLIQNKETISGAQTFLLKAFLPAILSSVMTTITIRYLGDFSKKDSLAGKYKVETYNQKTSNWDDFGITEIKPSFFTDELRFNGCDMNGQLILKGEGRLNNLRFICGHYYKTQDDLGIRFGSFMYEVDFKGTTFEGRFCYVDENTGQVKTEKARWLKE